MKTLRTYLDEHPALPRTLPFVMYIIFLAFEDVIMSVSSLGQFDARLIYPFKVTCVALLLVYFWHFYAELAKFKLRLHEVLRSVAVGLGVFLLWINLDYSWMSFALSAGYDPRNLAGGIDWSLALFRLLGAAIVVPIMEELFWRSFLLRWLAHSKFLDVSPAQVGLRALLISSVMFGMEHALWLAGIIAGLAYSWLYMKSKNLWGSVVAHATTNGLLGLWVLYTGQWHFW
jgi:CAAX prenyl protease-like protein